MDFDFLPSNLQIAYPFQQNVVVERYGADTYIAPIVAAAQIRTVDQRDDDLLMERVYLETTDDFGTLDEAYIKLKWSLTGDLIELDLGAGTCTAVVQAYGNWVAVEWWGPQELSGLLTAVIKLVFPTSAIEDAGAFKVIEITEKADDLTLHSSTVKQGPNEVRRVYWKYGSTLELVADRGEPLIIRPGFNMSIEQVEEVTDGFQAQEFTIVEGRPQTRVAINAVPGAGLGKYLLCPGSLYLLTLNGVGPNTQGDLQLQPVECYWLERALSATTPSDGTHGIVSNSTLLPNEVRIKSGCGPCCSCEAYIDTYTHLRDIWDRAVAAAAALYSTRDTLQLLSVAIEEYQESSLPNVVALDLNDTEDQIIVVLAYSNLSAGTTINPEALWASDPLTFEMTFTPIDGVSSLTYKVGSGRMVNGRLTENVDPVSGTEDTWTPKVVATMEVPPRTVLYWVGKFDMGTTPSGETIECTAISSGGGSSTTSGSDTIDVT